MLYINYNVKYTATIFKCLCFQSLIFYYNYLWYTLYKEVTCILKSNKKKLLSQNSSGQEATVYFHLRIFFLLRTLDNLHFLNLRFVILKNMEICKYYLILFRECVYPLRKGWTLWPLSKALHYLNCWWTIFYK